MIITKKCFALPKHGNKQKWLANKEHNIAMHKIFKVLESSKKFQYLVEDLINNV